MIAPITPDDIVSEKAKQLPDAVIEVFNYFIARNYVGSQAVVKQEDVVVMLVEKLQIERRAVFDKRYLSVKSLYENAGWDVEYDKPAYNEHYDPTFTFKRKRV